MKQIDLSKILTKKNIIIAAIILAFIVIFASILISSAPEEARIVPNSEELETTKLHAAEVFKLDTDSSLGAFTSNKSDESALLVKNGAEATLRDTSLIKADGETSDEEKAERVGLNSVLVVSYGSKLSASNIGIESSINSSNAVFISGKKTTAEFADSTIETYGLKSAGAVVATSAELTGERLTIVTKMKEAPAIKLLSIYGSATLNNSTIETHGQSSPLIYGKGKIVLKNTTGNAYGSRFAYLEGAKVKISGSTLVAKGQGDTDNEIQSGFHLVGTIKNTLDISNSSLNINNKLTNYKVATLFSAKRTKADIKLEKTQLNYGSEKFLNADSSTINLETKTVNILGNFELTKSSTLDLSLKSNSLFMGNIIKESGSKANLTIDKTSKIILNSDLYLNKFTNEDKSNSNIVFGNYKIYVNNQPIN